MNSKTTFKLSPTTMPSSSISSPSLPSISPLFTAKKHKILSALAVPDDAYTDLSPKGSVDEGLKDLIHEINALDGFVTTSSCAGRTSVFLEGQKGNPTKHGNTQATTTDDDPSNGLESEKAVPGGKGMGGRWLFVSHDPAEMPSNVHALLGLEPQAESSDSGGSNTGGPPRRLVRFQFEPMILHVLTSSLAHASMILSAALNAGFRESGVQSLKSLHDPNAFPMVAVRTAGLGLSSVVGYVVDAADGVGDGNQARSLVGEEYLAMMLRLANERFKENEERIERFRCELRRTVEREVRGGGKKGEGENGEWEDVEVRRMRMRREGLAKKKEMMRRGQRDTSETFGGNDAVGALEEGLDLELAAE